MNLLTKLCRQRDLKQRIANSHTRLYRTAYAWSHNPDLAADLVQECMTKALDRLKQLRDPDKLDSWLFGILLNCWRDHFRQQRVTVNIDDIEMAHEDSPEHLHETHNMILNVRQSIAKLPEAQRQIVTLVNLEGFSYAEVADILKIPVGTVMSRLSRARNTLAKYLLNYKTNHDLSKDKPKLRSIK